MEYKPIRGFLAGLMGVAFSIAACMKELLKNVHSQYYVSFSL
jgi:hypothetical protein